jgi:hypothetical protein
MFVMVDINSMSTISISSPKWISGVAKFGLAAKGVVYCLSGLIALMAALHLGGNSTEDAGAKGVFSFIEDKPFGKWMVLVVAIGLASFSLWRFIQTFKDTEHKGSDKKGLAKRLAYLVSALAYAALSIYAFNAFAGNGGKGDGKEGWIAELLSKPFGQWIVGIIAAIMIGTGIYQIYRAASGNYKKYVREALHNDKMNWISTVGVAGYAARGIVWLIVGWLFIKAALHSNPKEAGSNEDAFKWLQDSSYGTILLAIISAGLICYGIFMLLRARYQSISTS